MLGASPDTHRIRGRLLHQLRENGFPGRILPINPSYQDIDGLRCYAAIGDVGEPVDLALVAIPAAGVAPALDECARAGVKNALIISSGFAEEGGAAGDMQAALVEVTRRTGIRACGPNCEGYFNALGRVATTFSPTVEVKEDEGRVLVSDRRVGVIAQSGGIGFALFNRGKAAGIGFSYVISTGNEADLNTADFLDYMVEDSNTHAVMLFCEAVRNGPTFIAALAKARRLGKPIIAMKIGRSDAGSRASASHTASLSGSYTAYRAVFERYGVIEAEDPDEAVAIAGVLLTCPLPKGRRTGIITPSGGGGAWMADTLSLHGLIVPPLSAATQATLRAVMPSYGASGNPVDVTAQGSNTAPALMTAMETLAESDEIDMVVLITSLTSETRVSLDAETGARDGGALRQADDGVDLHAAIRVRPKHRRWVRAVHAQRSAQCRCRDEQACRLRGGAGAAPARLARQRAGLAIARGSAACADRASCKGAVGALWFAGIAGAVGDFGG